MLFYNFVKIILNKQMNRVVQILLLLMLSTFDIGAQSPKYFGYDDESGLPSNEVYSIVQDQKDLFG